MDLNIILSRSSALLVLLSAIIWPLRAICAARDFKGRRCLLKVWRFLRKIHIPLGTIATAVVYLHCRVAFKAASEQSVVGVVLLLCMLGVCATGLLKKALPRYWLRLHKLITLVMFIFLIIHCFIEFNT